MKSETKISEKELVLISRSLDEELSELDKRRLSQKVLSKQVGAQVWTRYHAASAVMRKQFPAQLDKDFSRRVMDVIENDGQQHEVPAATGVHGVRSTFKHIAGLAVAASVATVSVISYQYFNQPATDGNSLIANEIEVSNPIQANTSISVQTLPVEFSPAQLSEPEQELLSMPEVEANIYFQQMNPYIQDHSGFGSQRTMTPYVEIIELKEIQE